MPGIVRANTDRNVKHEDPVTPLPFHSFPYVKTGANVFVNRKPAIVVGDKTSCGDEALVGSLTSLSMVKLCIEKVMLQKDTISFYLAVQKQVQKMYL